jgi:hypothetical protein
MADSTIFEVPKAQGGLSVVELADGSRVYRKQLVKFGSYVNPHNRSSKMVLDRSWAEPIADNFRKKVLNKSRWLRGIPATCPTANRC